MRVNLKNIPVRYINLLQDKDKNVKMRNLLDGYQNVVRIDAKYIEDNKILALSMSQKIAIESLSTPGFILEDDCEKLYYREEIEVPDDADIVFLGIWKPERPAFNIGNIIPSYEIVNEDLVRVYNMTGSHAIMYVSDKGKELATAAYDIAIRTELWNDVVLNRILPFINAYALRKPIFYQTSMEKETRIEYSSECPSFYTDFVTNPDDL